MHSQKSSFFLPVAALLIALIFVADVLTPLGYAEWTLYVVPVALCLFVGQAAAPLVGAFACSILLGLGHVVARDGTGADVALINRALGAAAIWVVALVGTRFITARREIERLTWLERGKALISARVAGVQQPEEIGANALAALVEHTRCVTGVFYRLQDGQLLRIGASALAGEVAAVLPIGSGLAGQAAKEGQTRVLGPLADDYLTVGSALGRMKPRALVVSPTRVDGEVNGVLEVAYMEPPARLGLTAELLRASSEVIGVALHAAVSRIRLQNLLEETQRQGEELQTQQEELRVSNEELEEQGNALRESKEQLEQQQAELEQSNVQLEEYSNHLERQKQELLAAQKQLKANAEALARSNQFKSEFLANMSHELRTPLNSSLILSKLLADNADGSLSDVQVRYARTIHSSNHDLLNLINDILDLAKIEAGKVDVAFEQVALRDLLEPLKATFEPVARQARVGFRVDVAPGTPDSIDTDMPRLLQILRNLLSNAFKFTREGEVVLTAAPAGGTGIQFAVRDTGIGIEPSKQQVIFEAFRQADGSTSRQYGGTGLGLSISRQLAKLLQGAITVASVPDQGSTFTVRLPLAPVRPSRRQEEADMRSDDDFAGEWDEDEQYPMAPPPLPGFTSELKEAMDALAVTPPRGSQAAPERPAPHRASDDSRRDAQTRRERTILLIEDDESFAGVVKELAGSLDFECVVTDSALEGLALARELRPRGILLDIGLPDRSGLAVLEQLKRDPATRPIPVHVVSASDHTQVALELGAIGYVQKPAMPAQLTEALKRVEEQSRRELKTVLIVEDDETLRDNLILLLRADRVELVGVGTVGEALRLLDERSFDCMVMDLGLPDGSGFELLERMSQGGRYAFPPVIVYTGRTISRDEEQRLRRFSSSIIIKGARSPDRLVDEVTLFLHQVESNLPPDQQRLLKMARSRDAVLDGRRILLAEDDARNVFALVNVLEPLGAAVDVARNGREAVDKLRGSPEVDLVLMDIMMPEMDGFAAMQAIRGDANIGRVPIIALTANAMPEDRVKCLEAGANDYIAKPIDVDRLVSLCRVWMPK